MGAEQGREPERPTTRALKSKSFGGRPVTAVVIGYWHEMVVAPSLAVPYLPHQRVIVFQADLMSGDTLGYHGTVMRLHATSHRQHPSNPERWIYRVSIPCLRREVDVASIDLFATEALNDSPLASESAASQPVCEVRFETQIGEDNNQIDGDFRMPSRKWVRFTFRKNEQSQAEYKLSFQLDGFQLGSGHLRYNVPMFDRLDRQYVLRAIASIVGTEKRHGDTTP